MNEGSTYTCSPVPTGKPGIFHVRRGSGRSAQNACGPGWLGTAKPCYNPQAEKGRAMTQKEASFQAQGWGVGPTMQPGDRVHVFWTRRGRPTLLILEPGGVFHSHYGIIRHDDLIGRPWGLRATTHKGEPFYALPPSLEDLLRLTPRRTQILFPKDIGFVLLKMSIGPGTRVIEAGTGSGALTTALAFYVGNEGRVYSYERRPDMQALARKNLEALGLAHRVTFHLRDIAEGFLEQDVDALFLDVPTPEAYISQARAALKPGGAFGALVPTTNQVSRLLAALSRERFAFIEVCEILLRYYKPVAKRLRPADRMVAHTGYLIFARAVVDIPQSEQGHADANAGEPPAE